MSGRYGTGSTTPVDRFVWHPVALPAPDADPDALRGRRIVVAGGAAGERDDVRDALRRAGAQATALASPEPGDTLEVIAAGAQAAVDARGQVDGIVDLGPERPFVADRHEAWRLPLAQTAALMQAVYDDWAAETDATRCFYLAVTWLGGRLGYDRRDVAQPLGGVWAGMAKSLPHELPNCRVKVLDLAADEAGEVGALVVAEASVWDFYEIGRRRGERFTLAGRAAPAPPPRLQLGRDDAVLISGGGRGVGFAFARKLAEAVGCRVVVTGRSPLPDPTAEPWVAMSQAEWAAQRRARLARATPGTVGDVRREDDRRDALREVAANLREASAAALPIEYRPCDFLDPAQVEALVADLGDRLRVVIHNAGIAAPTRLRRKSLATVLRVVESKLVSFVNLAHAVRGRPLDLFCNVGSVAGRMGGMIGQIDYAGANDVLARLGFWAEQELGLRVATLCWTTWERIGLIANYDAALRYGAALAIDEGVERWLAELLGAERGEVMFLGRVGTALAPSQIRGFAKFGDHPDLPWLLSRQHYLGEVLSYAPFRSLETRTPVRADRHPCGSEFTVDGRSALPVGVALEYAVSLGDWVTPEGWPVLHLRALRDVRVDLLALGAAGTRLTLRKHAVGARSADGWVVDTRLEDAASGRELLRAALVFADAPAEPARAAGPSAATGDWTPSPGRLAWRGAAIRRARWRTAGSILAADVRAAADSDLWALPHPPLARLPVAAIEAIVQAASAGSGTRLQAAALDCTPSGAPEAHVIGGSGAWQVLDAAGATVMRAAGVTVT